MLAHVQQADFRAVVQPALERRRIDAGYGRSVDVVLRHRGLQEIEGKGPPSRRFDAVCRDVMSYRGALRAGARYFSASVH